MMRKVKEEAMLAAKAKVEKAESEAAAASSSTSSTKGMFSSLYTTSMESLKQKAAAATADWEKSKSITQSKEIQLSEEKKRRDQAMHGIMMEMQQIEQQKWTVLSSFFTTFTDKHRQYQRR